MAESPLSTLLPFIEDVWSAGAVGAATVIGKHFKNNRAPTLYHYTSAEGLYGMLKGKTYWATHFQHLNDRMECQVFMDSARQLARRKVGERRFPTQIARAPSLEETVDFLWTMINSIDSQKHLMEPYIVSFSNLPDDLAQWRAYGDSGKGFAVGFRTMPMVAVQGGWHLATQIRCWSNL